MAKILIYKDVVPNGEYDIFRTIDYQKFRDEVGESACYNVGNRAWLQGIIVALEDGKNELVFLTKEMTPSQINAEFDFIVLPMENIFQRRLRIRCLRICAMLLERSKAASSPFRMPLSRAGRRYPSIMITAASKNGRRENGRGVYRRHRLILCFVRMHFSK